MGNNKLIRSEVDKKVFGVAAGLGNYFNIDPAFVRAGFVLGTLFLAGPLVPIGYCVLGLVMSPPDSPAGRIVSDGMDKAQEAFHKAKDTVNGRLDQNQNGSATGNVDYVDTDEIDEIKRKMKVEGDDDFLV